MVLKRFTNIIHRKSGNDDDSVGDGDTPEANAARGVRLFCESGGTQNAGEEVLHLPTIVEAAESSPAAAGAAASQIRKFLSKDNYARPHVQYNAIMLIRILTDNPGPTFTKHMDAKFTGTVKDLLRHGKDPSVRQILHETLNALYFEKAYDTNLSVINAMWTKEHGPYVPGPNRGPAAHPQSISRTTTWPQNDAFARPPPRHHRGPPTLPPPAELAARIEEARTSAKLLLQLCQSTPPAEMQANDLIREFAERCQTAQRSLQGYMNCEDPAPDDPTMQTLIETSEQLSLAGSKHQRAMLAARRALGQSGTPSPPVPARHLTSSAPSLIAPLPPTTTTAASPGAENPLPPAPASQPPPSAYAPPSGPPPPATAAATDNPFSDDHAAEKGGAGGPARPAFATGPSSYARRQENAVAAGGMRGGLPTEEEEEAEERYARQAAAAGGRRGTRESGGTVSPVEERGVTYRY